MSNYTSGIGLRMLSVRKEHGFTQTVAAAKLDISDRTYNYYEQEKRELPLSVAVRFCELFSTDLKWLVLGDSNSVSAKHLELIAESVVAVLNVNEHSTAQMSFENLGQFVANVYERCATKEASPSEVATRLSKMME